MATKASSGDGAAADPGAARRGPVQAVVPGPRHVPPARGHRWLRLTALTLTGILAFVAVGASASYVDLKSQITVDDVDPLLGDDRPEQRQVSVPTTAPDPVDPFAGQPLNIVVMGTDLRDGTNEDLAGEADGMRSDSTFVVHVAADRTRAEIVSIPRDSLVAIPSCTRADGSTTGSRRSAMFNTAFTLGGGAEEDIASAAACTRRTVEQLTGVLTTDHVVVQMNGVEPIVDAIGGVRMCLPEEMHGKRPDLDLPAGEQVLDGRTSIDFLRVRHGTGFGLEAGSDLTRITRQQAFLDAMAREVLSKNIVTDAPKLYRVVQQVLASISTSPALASPVTLGGLAFSLRSMPSDRILFTSLPVVEAPSDPNRVVWTSEADAIWERIAADEEPPVSRRSTPATPATSPRRRPCPWPTPSRPGAPPRSRSRPTTPRTAPTTP
ncbi:hypothetical protein GCM10025865_01840 [Paraoerskovia sediminicola]|uniref:Cell envelope-related transcriptional attenuator domain-containing protein n=1 Tax=Paraoerskovia sediminicola TaxID=1138587 RepID=A0ABN6X7V8_9CELL|nr:LCP family protein [Paraoerskovia sediminicola]BDZ40885.1 hypothetical protein GCM10025865_01840 [Paraoerskovia sediminicola]